MASLSDSSQDSMKKSSRHAFHKAWKNITIGLRPQFLRKLGFADSDVDKLLNNNDLDMFQFWKDVDENDPDIFELVQHEVYSHKRNEKVDQLLNANKARKSFRKNRKMAWFIYGFCRFYYDDKIWKDTIIRKKFQPENAQLMEIESNYKGNFAERQYRMMMIWMNTNRLNNVRQIMRKLEDLNLQIPETFSLQSEAERSTGENRSAADNSPDMKLYKSEIEDSDSESSVDSGEEDEINKLVATTAEKLHQHLKTVVDEKCGREYGRAVEPVDLVLVKYTGQKDRDPDKHRVKLARVVDEGDELKGDITIENMFERARIEAEGNKKDEKSVGMVGAVGVGKSTLTKVIVQKILDKKILPNASFVFYITVGSIDLERETDLTELLFSSLIAEGSLSEDETETKELINFILKDPNTVVIIDGLDEAKTVNLHSYQHVSPFKPAKPMALLYNILNGNILKNAYKLVTSRISQFIDASPEYRPKFVLEILGLAPSEQQKLARCVCGEQFDRVWKILQDSPALLECCVIPVNMLMAVNFLLGGGGTSGTITLTGVYIAMLNRYIRSKHCSFEKGTDVVKKLCDLAFDGWQKNKSLFSDEDLEQFKIPLATQQAFVNAAVDSDDGLAIQILQQDKVSYFVHRSWQELLVALRLVLFMPLNEFKSFLENAFESGDLENVVKFCFGICKDSVFKKARRLSPAAQIDEIEEKKMFLGLIAESKAKKLSEYVTESDKGHDMQKWFHLFACLNELGSDDISLPVTKLLPTVADIEGSVFTSDITNMASLYKLNKTTLYLKTVHPSFVGNALQSFGTFVQEHRVKIYDFDLRHCPDEQVQFAGSFLSHVERVGISLIFLFGSLRDSTDRSRKGVLTLARSIKDGLLQIDHPHQMKKLDLSNIPFRDEGVSILSSEVGKVAELDIGSVGMTSVGAVKLGEHLEMETTQSMVRLNISDNKVGDIGACAITKSIHKMKKLEMDDCGITFKGMPGITRNILNSQTKIPYLDLSNNKFGDDGVQELGKCLHLVEKLILHNCNITSTGADALAGGLSKLQTPMDELDLCGNPIGDLSAAAMSKCLSNVKSLGLGCDLSNSLTGVLFGNAGCGITSNGISHIAAGLLSLQEPMQSLNLSGNKLVDDGTKKLSKCLHQVKRLDLHQCEITSTGLKTLAGGLSTLQTPMDELDLGGNPIGDLGAAAMSKCVSNVKSLGLGRDQSNSLAGVWFSNPGCGITSKGISHIAAGLLSLQEPMQYLNLSFNKFGDNGAKKLSKCLHQVKRLDLHQCGITLTGVAALVGGLSTLQTPMEKLWLDWLLKSWIDADDLKILESKVEKLKWDI